MSHVMRPGVHRGTVALVTGGGAGIGCATATLDLARCGADVVICGRRPGPLEKTVAEIEALGARGLAVPADIRDEHQVPHLIDVALERFGRIDTLVNDAGGQFSAPAEQITNRGWRAVHDLALDATWSVTREVAVRAMIPQRSGAIFFLAFSPRRGPRWRTWPPDSRWSGAGSASGPSASPPARSRPRHSSSTTPGKTAPSGRPRCRCAASGSRTRSPA
jgi:citronellol/citronellal dehydrogenase